MIASFMHVPYRDGGRTMDGADCWGLVRLVRESMGLNPLPMHDCVGAEDKAGLTDKAQQEMATTLEECSPEPGAIATVWRGTLCIHVGVCTVKEGRLGVLDSGRKTGVRWMLVSKFERLNRRVIYLHDRSLYEPR